MLQISFLAKTFQSLCLRKRINFTSAFYESPTDIIPYNHTRRTRTRAGLIILILKLQENSPGCHGDLFISRLVYNIFLFNYDIFRFFQMCFTLLFVLHVLFYIFHLGKLLLALNTLIAIPVNLNFFLI